MGGKRRNFSRTCRTATPESLAAKAGGSINVAQHANVEHPRTVCRGAYGALPCSPHTGDKPDALPYSYSSVYWMPAFSQMSHARILRRGGAPTSPKAFGGAIWQDGRKPKNVE
jgi:hypothetical protein